MWKLRKLLTNTVTLSWQKFRESDVLTESNYVHTKKLIGRNFFSGESKFPYFHRAELDLTIIHTVFVFEKQIP